jgi:putative ABC transport system substrate-binding protein
MRRRDFIAGIGGVAAAWPLAARAQHPGDRVPHIAYLGALSPSTLDPRQIEQFKVGLAENGLIDGQTIGVDYLWAEGSTERLQQLAAELGRRELDVIVTAGPQPVRAVLATGTKTPVVFAILNDPISDGFVRSLAHPGGNVTGLSMAGSDLESKRLEVLKDAVPTVAKVLILHDPSMGQTGLAAVRAAAQALALELVMVEENDPARFASVFAAAVAEGVNGLATMASPLLNFQRKQLIALAGQYRLPSIWESSGYVRDGGLVIWSEFPRHVSPRGRLRRKDTAWSQAGGAAGGAAGQIRACRECANRQGARHRTAGNPACARRRGDRVSLAPANAILLHLLTAAFGTWRLSLRCTKFRRDWRYCGHRLAPAPIASEAYDPSRK